MQCRGHRGNGESFLADVWFSSYKEGATPKLAAIIADVTEERSAIAESVSTLSNDQARTPLNNRESDVLRLLVQGLANKEIASRLDISESAVKNTIQQLFAKTEVRTRSQLVRVALERYTRGNCRVASHSVCFSWVFLTPQPATDTVRLRLLAQTA
jgi:DNA-binding CsgD family transcriptional regulator